MSNLKEEIISEFNKLLAEKTKEGCYYANSQWVYDFLSSKLDEIEKEVISAVKHRIGSIDIKEHACRFNDGDCNCGCYIAGLEDAVKSLSKLATTPPSKLSEKK